MNQYEGMNGLEVLYTILFVEWDKGLWGIIALGCLLYTSDAADES